MINEYRLSSGGKINRSESISFKFNGKTLYGYKGDTLASALLANGIHLVGRSFKYHRPRGFIGAGVDEPNAKVQTYSGNNTEPNVLATEIQSNIVSKELTPHDLFSAVSMHSVSDFDNVKENSRNGSAGLISDEVIFENQILSDYAESQSNRVLTIDDFSGTFNSNPRSTRYTTVGSWTLSERRALKYFLYVKDKRFTAQRQLSIVDILHDSNLGYINQYGRLDTVYDQGSFDFAVSINRVNKDIKLLCSSLRL